MNPTPRPAPPEARPDSFNTHPFRAVPAGALRLLVIGSGAGRLGAVLKAQDGRRQVFGVERHPHAAAAVLDRVFALDPEYQDVPLEPGSLDALLYADALEHFADPLTVLLRHRQRLRPGGLVLCCLPNVQHHALLTDLLKGDWQYRVTGLLDRGHLRFFSYATALKLLLDAGFAPRIVDAVKIPAPDALMRALLPLLGHLGLHPERTRHYLESYQYVLRGDLLPDALEADDEAGQVRFLPGWFKDTLPAAPVERLAVLRLDGDLYESTWEALASLYPKVSPGGYVIIDDYLDIAACRQAVDDYRRAQGITADILPIDWTAVYWRRR